MGILGKVLGKVVPMGDVEVEIAIDLVNHRRYVEALAHLSAALEKPLKTFNKGIIYALIGRCRLEIGQLDEAEQVLLEAFQENPKYEATLTNLGIVYRMKGDYEKAESYYRQALEIKPKHAPAHVSLGALCIFQDKYAEAIEHLERAVKLDASLAIGHADLAVAYAGVGRFEDAAAEVKMAVARGYTDPEALATRIEELRKLEHPPEKVA